MTAATVLVTRAYLTATGFPQVGGSLHIAHVLPGGLLMVIGLTIASTSIGSASKAWGSFVGGIGFGLFVDEIGKFLTRDNNYFYRPTFAVMYGVLVVVYVLGRELIIRRPVTERHVRAIAAQAVADDALGQLSPRRREEILSLVGRHASEQTRVLYDGLLVGDAPAPRFNPDEGFGAALRASSAVVGWLADRRIVRGVIWAYLTLQVAAAVLVAAAIVALAVNPEAADGVGPISGSDTALAFGLVAQGVPLAIGLVLLVLRRRRSGLRFLRVGLLIGLTYTLVIEFGQEQLGAITQFAIALLCFAIIGALLRREPPRPASGAAGRYELPSAVQ